MYTQNVCTAHMHVQYANSRVSRACSPENFEKLYSLRLNLRAFLLVNLPFKPDYKITMKITKICTKLKQVQYSQVTSYIYAIELLPSYIQGASYLQLYAQYLISNCHQRCHSKAIAIFQTISIRKLLFVILCSFTIALLRKQKILKLVRLFSQSTQVSNSSQLIKKMPCCKM